MADNFLATEADGTQTDFAADDISDVKYPRHKIALGAANAYDMDLDSGQQTMANSLPVALASDQSALPVSQSGTWTVQPGNTANSTPWLVTVSTALPAGTSNIGDVDVASIAAGSNLIGDVSLQPRTGNGLTIFRSIDLDETEEEIKATAGNLYGYYFANTNAAARYLKLYNATAANVTVGSTTPACTFYLPPTSAGHIGFPYPISFSTAITAAATTGVTDADTGAPGANEVIFNAFYK